MAVVQETTRDTYFLWANVDNLLFRLQYMSMKIGDKARFLLKK